MDWQPIIIDVLSVTSILSIIAMVRFWKQNKKLKDNEVKLNDSQVTQSNVETQEKEINLANLYKEEVLKVIKLLKDNQNENTGNQKEILGSLNNLDRRMDRFEVRLGDIEGYLNGPYHEYLAKQERAANRYEASTTTTTEEGTES